jgi:hypothetical protein
LPLCPRRQAQTRTTFVVRASALEPPPMDAEGRQMGAQSAVHPSIKGGELPLCPRRRAQTRTTFVVRASALGFLPLDGGGSQVGPQSALHPPLAPPMKGGEFRSRSWRACRGAKVAAPLSQTDCLRFGHPRYIIRITARVDQSRPLAKLGVCPHARSLRPQAGRL